uniref:Uncharacterized protein n=1 Tax=Sphaerodactylus townsendi TaxID=933632 RepID=A0ACB8F8Y9_9SAUR
MDGSSSWAARAPLEPFPVGSGSIGAAADFRPRAASASGPGRSPGLGRRRRPGRSCTLSYSPSLGECLGIMLMVLGHEPLCCQKDIPYVSVGVCETNYVA